MRKYILTFILLSIIIFIKAQTPPNQKPCSSPEASQFDFWMGDWELTWNDTSKGTNQITRIMNGCTLHEFFFDPVLKARAGAFIILQKRYGNKHG